MAGLGVSMGAGVLALYCARVGTLSKLDSCFGVSCHFETERALSHIQTNFFGLYNKAVANPFKNYAHAYYSRFDSLAANRHPERLIGKATHSVSVATDITAIFAKAAGLSVTEYVK